jgi:DNA-binding IclR family transcriptional regulator
VPRTSEPGRTVSSRLLQVLFSFDRTHTRMTLAELTRATGMAHATVRRLVVELVAAGALQHGDDGQLSVGVRLWQLGTLAPMAEPLRMIAKPFMDDLNTALRQHVQLAVLDGNQALVIERLSEPHAVGLASGVGGPLPLHCSGVGKVLLSAAEPDLIDAVLSRPLRKFTERTLLDPDRLRRDLAESRQTGTAIVRGELTDGADSVAARVMNSEGRVVAAVSVVVASGTVRPAAVLPAVVTSGLAISRMLGWQPQTRRASGQR